MRYLSATQKCIALLMATVLTVGGVIAFSPRTYAREIQSYTYEIPVNALIRVETNLGTQFVPSGSGEFEIRADSPTVFTIYYRNSLYNLLPSIFFNSGTKPVSMEYGLDVDVSWDQGFAASAGGTMSIAPSFSYQWYTNQVWFGSQLLNYPLEPTYINYNQHGNDYGTLWQRNLSNDPYSFQTKIFAETNIPTYDTFGDNFTLGIGCFKMNNIFGDDVNGDGYGLVFTINRFYVTFNYIDDTGFDIMQDIDDKLSTDNADFDDSSDGLNEAVGGVLEDYEAFEKDWQDEVNAIYDQFDGARDPWDPGLLDAGLILNASGSFTKSFWDVLMSFAPIGAFITAGLLCCMAVFFLRR